MPRRILLIGENINEAVTNIGDLLAFEAGFHCRSLSWAALRSEKPLQSAADLVVAVAVPQTAKSMTLFQWLLAHPMDVPILSVLSSVADNDLFQIASEVADDFLLWPIRRSELHQRLSRVLGPESNEVESIQSRLVQELGLAQLVGKDPVFVKAVEKLPRLAVSDFPVLITGETGTGKELCARAIHHLGKRRNSPFIPVDCGAIPTDLFENELFGHVRGAFTDAHKSQKGLAAMAEGGTLFFDEVDALSPVTQVKLMRFLQEHTYRPLGSEFFSRANVNFIAATNVDLEAQVRRGNFRPDLYFRLNVLQLSLPPLRERRQDILLLAAYFLKSLKGTIRSFSSPAMRMLNSYDWPGNVRELANVVQRAFMLCDGKQIEARHISFSGQAPASDSCQGSFKVARVQAIERFERVYVEEVLLKHNGNITKAARAAGKERRAFGRLVKKYGINPRAI
ncbi:sigma-54 dependent transcriptional regulator [Candidatus Zixiibacteriota bacterium]